MLEKLKQMFTPEPSRELWIKADLAHAEGRHDDERAIYRRLARRKLHSALDYLYAGLSESRLGNPDAAMDRLEAGLDHYPDTAYLTEHHSRICVEQGQVERILRRTGLAVDKLEQGCKDLFDKPFINDATRFKLIAFCIENGFSDIAQTYLERIRAGCSDPVTLWQIAEIHTRCGHDDEAKEIFRTLVGIEPVRSEDVTYAALSALRLGNASQCLDILERGQAAYPDSVALHNLYRQVCGMQDAFQRYATFTATRVGDSAPRSCTRYDFFRALIAGGAAELLIFKYRDIASHCEGAQLSSLLDEMFSVFRRNGVTPEKAKLLVFHARHLDLDDALARKLFEFLHELLAGKGPESRRHQHALRMIYTITPPMAPYRQISPEALSRRFLKSCEDMSLQGHELDQPVDVLTHYGWAPWQAMFCSGSPALYPAAVSALERVLRDTFPKLGFTAPHVGQHSASAETTTERIRVGFIVHDSMPMMSGLAASLDKRRFEAIFLHPGDPGTTRAAKDWVARVDPTIGYSALDLTEAINTIAAQRLDIIVSGPSMGSVFLPVMARLATLQMVLLEPNWTNGMRNTDYYISWKPAEPTEPADFYANAVAYLEHPPYWIERPLLNADLPLAQAVRSETRMRLLGCDADRRVYLCANTPPKIHPDMDEMFAQLLARDPDAVLVFLRGEFPPAKTLKARFESRPGLPAERILFLPTMGREDAHALLLAVDCCLDSFPLCGMSSSFDGAMLGIPIVTWPHDIPFGRWTAAIYEYIGVSGLTASSREEYLQIALRLASDPQWRHEKAVEIKRKASRYVESEASSAEFQDFLLNAWERERAGSAPANWIDGRWQAVEQPAEVHG